MNTQYPHAGRKLTPEEVATAVRTMSDASHHELSMLIAVLTQQIHDNASLSDSCRRAVVEQLDEIADEIDADLVNQMAAA